MRIEEIDQALWDGVMLLARTDVGPRLEDAKSCYDRLMVRYESDPFRIELTSFGRLMPVMIRTHGYDYDLIQRELRASLELFPLTWQVAGGDSSKAFPIDRVIELVKAWRAYRGSFS